MTFYDNPENVAKYTQMCEGFDATNQLAALFNVLPEGKRILEIGSGPGNDLAILAAKYLAHGTDSSTVFVNLLKERFPNLNITKSSAEDLDISVSFDAIYSNKVLHHLDDAALRRSFAAQSKLLNRDGLVFHLIWQKIETTPPDFGLPFIARDLAGMQEIMSPNFEVLDTFHFAEFAEADSLAILAKKLSL